MDGLKTVILDAGSDREIGQDLGTLLLIQIFLTSSGRKDGEICCSMTSALHPEGYKAMLVYPSMVWAFLTVLVQSLGLIIILKKGWYKCALTERDSIKCQFKDSSVQA